MKDFIKGRLSKLLFVLFIPMLLFMLAPQSVVNAADISNNISSLTVSSSEITDGGQTTVKFTFDEHAQKIKAGDMHADDPEHILWVLTINAMNLEVDGDVRVEDEVQGGHKLVTESFKITTTGNKPGYFSGATAIEDFKAAFPRSTFTVDASGKFVVTIPKDLINKTGVLIFYRTKLENDAQKDFKNNTKVWYQVKGEAAVVAKEVNASVANINANGGVDGDQSIPTTAGTTTTESTTVSTNAGTTTTESTTISTTAATTTSEGSSTTEGSTTGVTTGETTDTTTVTPAPETTTTTVKPDLPNTGTSNNTAVILAGIIVTISAMFVLVSKKAEQN